MARKILLPEGTQERMQILMRQTPSASLFRKMQVVLLGAQGMSAEVIAPITQYKIGYIRELWMQFRRKGEVMFIERKRQCRNRSHLSFVEEQTFLMPFFKAAEKAGILIVSDIHTSLEGKIGKSLSKQTTYNLLHRHNWRKIAPRPYHPKRDSEKRKQWLSSFPPRSSKGKR